MWLAFLHWDIQRYKRKLIKSLWPQLCARQRHLTLQSVTRKQSCASGSITDAVSVHTECDSCPHGKCVTGRRMRCALSSKHVAEKNGAPETSWWTSGRGSTCHFPSSPPLTYLQLNWSNKLQGNNNYTFLKGSKSGSFYLKCGMAGEQ